jgi:hypothetical protein
MALCLVISTQALRVVRRLRYVSFHNAARNVLLLSLIADRQSVSSTKLWNIFFNLKLDQPSLDLLVSQSRKLLKLSEDIDTWHESNYGAFLRFCTSQTLLDLRRFWTRYARAKNHTAQEKARLQTRFAAAMNKDDIMENMSTSRSAGPLVALAISAPLESFQRFWATGILSKDPQQLAAAINMNPLFAYSIAGDEFAVHYGTDPLGPFHLAAAVNSPKQVTTDDVVKTVMKQFQLWCDAFKDALLTAGKVIVRVFAGDALRFGRALLHLSTHQSQDVNLRTSLWRATPLELDGGAYATHTAPISFNVIDTSNLIDHIGLMNVLITVAPLLSSHPSSTLFTEALRSSANDPGTEFLPRLCGDVTIMSLLLGLTPVAFVSGFTSRSNTHETLIQMMVPDSRQHFERVSWKHPLSGDATTPGTFVSKLRFEPVQLARFLFTVYLQMFADEDLHATIRDMTIKTPRSGSLLHYIRETFAAFLRIVKDRVETNWKLVMDTFMAALEQDKTLLMGPNNAQDLICQLHMYGIHTVDMIRPWLPEGLETTQNVFRGWTRVPPVVCIVLVVPREKLRPLLIFGKATPVLHCIVYGPTANNIFSSVQTSFGTVTATGSGENRKVFLMEDDAGWEGTSHVIATFWVPSWILSPRRAPLEHVNLAVRATPATAELLTRQLGLYLALFTVPLSDRKQLFVITECPTLNTASPITPTSPHSPPHSTRTQEPECTVSMNNTGTAVSTLAVRADIFDPEAKGALLDGAPVTATQISPCGMAVLIRDYKHILWYPWPVDGARCKVLIARKSHYVEVLNHFTFRSEDRDICSDKRLTEALLSQVVVPLFRPARPGALSILKFPVVFNRGRSTPWNVHRVNIDKLPAIETSNPEIIKMLKYHVVMSFSNEERALRDQGSVDTITTIKDALHRIFVLSSHPDGRIKRTVFALSESSMGGIDTLIFVTELRLDLASHTVIADACVLPLTRTLLENSSLKRHLGQIILGQPHIIEMVGTIVEAWKSLIVAWVERCRRWKHADNCEYLSSGNGAVSIPISTQYRTVPICGCGRGRDVHEFKRSFGQWKDLAPFLTRMAISPLFFASYMERGVRLPSIETSVEEALHQQSLSVASHRCALCKGEGKPKLLVCSKCKQIRYCSSSCQKADWRGHKTTCVQR